MSETDRKLCCLLMAVGLLGPTATLAWTPYGYGPYGSDYHAGNAWPPGHPSDADRSGTSELSPFHGYPPYGPRPDASFFGTPSPQTDDSGPGMGMRAPPVPFGPGFPGMEGPGYGGSSGPLQISRQATKDAYIIEIQLNGLQPEEIQVSTQGSWIRVGRDQSVQETKEDSFDQGRGYARSYSFSTGRTSRRFSVPRDADVGGMTREESETAVRILIPRRRY